MGYMSLRFTHHALAELIKMDDTMDMRVYIHQVDI